VIAWPAMDWVDLLTPSAAILALFVAIGLGIQSIRQGRHIRRLEQQVANGGGASSKASLERIQQLQTRAQVSQGGLSPAGGGSVRTWAIAGVSVLVLALIGGGVWFLFLHDSGGDSGSAKAATTATTRTTALPPDRSDLVPAVVPPLVNKGQYTVAILNGSGVSGAAGEKIGPLVAASGYVVGNVTNAPTSTVRSSVVMFPKAAGKVVAQNVAKDLGIRRARKVDGVSPETYGDADAVVIVGKDLANR
jgi:LytR cell envelope-related transcriptional attenuator